MSKNDHTPVFNTCVGPSMYPTMRSGDSYVLKKYRSIKEVKAGDIIVYPHPEEPMDVVHRIIKISGNKIYTRGDNNNKADGYAVNFEEVKGYVESVFRGDRQIQVSRGQSGMIRHKIMLIRKYLRPIFVKPVILITDKIALSRSFFFLHDLFKVKVIVIKRNDEIQEILKYKEKAIGKRMNNDPWKIRFPYRMFIDPEKL